jgi:hypothetical protein
VGTKSTYIPQKGLYPSTSHNGWMMDATMNNPQLFQGFLSCLICLGSSFDDGNNQAYNKEAILKP